MCVMHSTSKHSCLPLLPGNNVVPVLTYCMQGILPAMYRQEKSKRSATSKKPPSHSLLECEITVRIMNMHTLTSFLLEQLRVNCRTVITRYHIQFRSQHNFLVKCSHNFDDIAKSDNYHRVHHGRKEVNFHYS